MVFSDDFITTIATKTVSYSLFEYAPLYLRKTKTKNVIFFTTHVYCNWLQIKVDHN